MLRELFHDLVYGKESSSLCLACREQDGSGSIVGFDQ
jgi:hypothetical protein